MMVPAVGATAVGAGLLLPALAKAKSRAQSVSSVNQLKQLGLAARIYANDHQDKFPPAQTWCDLLQPLVGSAKVFKSASDPAPGPCSYGYNVLVSGMSDNKVDPQTVLFFETEAGWNKAGGPELLLGQPRSGGAYVFGFADGSVQMIAPARVGDLRWEP
jgi:hypothetical protein